MYVNENGKISFIKLWGCCSREVFFHWFFSACRMLFNFKWFSSWRYFTPHFIQKFIETTLSCLLFHWLIFRRLTFHSSAKLIFINWRYSFFNSLYTIANLYSITLSSSTENISLTFFLFLFHLFLYFTLFLVVFKIYIEKLSRIGSFINIKFKGFLQKNELTVEKSIVIFGLKTERCFFVEHEKFFGVAIEGKDSSE